jgi:hypothetical protein
MGSPNIDNDSEPASDADSEEELDTRYVKTSSSTILVLIYSKHTAHVKQLDGLRTWSHLC